MRTVVLAAALLAITTDAPQTPPALQGTWEARLHDTWTRGDGQKQVQLNLQDGSSQFGFSMPVAELEGLAGRDASWTARDVRFSIRRDAGVLVFQGSFSDGRGEGTYLFTPNAEYANALRARYGALSGRDLLRLTVHDVSRAFIARNGRLGRSWGCPAVPPEDMAMVIALLADGGLLYIHG